MYLGHVSLHPQILTVHECFNLILIRVRVSPDMTKFQVTMSFFNGNVCYATNLPDIKVRLLYFSINLLRIFRNNRKQRKWADKQLLIFFGPPQIRKTWKMLNLVKNYFVFNDLIMTDYRCNLYVSMSITYKMAVC